MSRAGILVIVQAEKIIKKRQKSPSSPAMFNSLPGLRGIASQLADFENALTSPTSSGSPASSHPNQPRESMDSLSSPTASAGQLADQALVNLRASFKRRKEQQSQGKPYTESSKPSIQSPILSTAPKTAPPASETTKVEAPLVDLTEVPPIPPKELIKAVDSPPEHTSEHTTVPEQSAETQDDTAPNEITAGQAVNETPVSTIPPETLEEAPEAVDTVSNEQDRKTIELSEKEALQLQEPLEETMPEPTVETTVESTPEPAAETTTENTTEILTDPTVETTPEIVEETKQDSLSGQEKITSDTALLPDPPQGEAADPLGAISSPIALHHSSDSSAAIPEANTTHTRETSGVSDLLKELDEPVDNEDLKKLKDLKKQIDALAHEFFGIEDVMNVQAVRDGLQALASDSKKSKPEIDRLREDVTQYKARVEEMENAQRKSAGSQSQLVDTLNKTISTRDQVIRTQENKLVTTGNEVVKLTATVSKLEEENNKLRLVAKEEEEKRTKALSLLRALRQKLVKVEADKVEVENERDSLRVSEHAAQEMIKTDRSRFDQEIINMRSMQEQQLNKLKTSFDREIGSLRNQHERELQSRKSASELDLITQKSLHTKELGTKDTRISHLEKTLRGLRQERDTLFDQLQLKTAEIESSVARQETLENNSSEAKYELKDAQDRASALLAELEQVKKQRRNAARDDENLRRQLEEAEKRHEVQIREMDTRAAQLEADRVEAEADMGKNLQDRLREVERMREQIAQKDIEYAESIHLRKEREEKMAESEGKRKELENKLEATEVMLNTLRSESQEAFTFAAAAKEELDEHQSRVSKLEQRLEEVQNKESSLRSHNKALREELRKLQSGVLSSEKQRLPGVGFFANHKSGQATSASMSASAEEEKKSLELDGDSKDKGEEALNFEYIRNVILQFLERPEMRQHLVGVLGVILQFTPAELRRLASKV